MDNLAQICKQPGPVDYIANAKTGSGKTVCDLWLSAELKTTTLIVVHTNRLKEQWIERIKQFFGEDFVRDYVGIAQQDKCDYSGRVFVIGLLPSLARRDYGIEFRRYFSKLTFDEVHRAAAPLMSEVLKKFPARIRGGYTATNRSDALKKVSDLHLGRPRVVSAQKVLRPICNVVRYSAEHSLNSYNDRTLLTSISQIPQRNKMICDHIEKGYRDGRNIVVLSDRTDQLVVLRDRLESQEVTSVGIYAGSYSTGRWKAIIREDKKILEKVFADTKTGVEESAYAYIKTYSENHYYNEDDKELGAMTVRISEEKYKPSPQEYEEMAENCQVLLATYGIFAEGLDVPRLDMGIEATPRGNVTQALGRVLRNHPNKPRPIWITIKDEVYSARPSRSTFMKPILYPLFNDLFEARMKSYSSQNATMRNL